MHGRKNTKLITYVKIMKKYKMINLDAFRTFKITFPLHLLPFQLRMGFMHPVQFQVSSTSQLLHNSIHHCHLFTVRQCVSFRCIIVFSVIAACEVSHRSCRSVLS